MFLSEVEGMNIKSLLWGKYTYILSIFLYTTLEQKNIIPYQPKIVQRPKEVNSLWSHSWWNIKMDSSPRAQDPQLAQTVLFYLFNKSLWKYIILSLLGISWRNSGGWDIVPTRCEFIVLDERETNVLRRQ